MSEAHEPLFVGVRATGWLADMVMGEDGTIVYVQGTVSDPGFELVWVDRDGREEPIYGD